MQTSRCLIAAPALVAAAFLAVAMPASSAELKVMSSGAYRAALEELVPAFEKASGNKLVVHYHPAAIVGRKIAAGEAFDVAIAGDKALEGLVEQGIVLAGSTAIVGVNGASLAYRRGAAKPDIATPDALKAVILNAKTISFSDPAGGGSSSNYFVGIIQQLGLTDEVQRKAILTEPGKGAFPVGEGKAEIGVAQTSEIAMAPGVEGVAIFPADPNSKSTYAAGVSAKSSETAAARDFVKFMLSPDAMAIRKSKGLAGD